MTNTPFESVFQIGIVVKDLDETVKTYNDKYGIGPWSFYDMDPGSVTEMISDGEERTYGCRMAAAKLGSTEIELIQPTDDHSRHARFLREKGEGIEHVSLRHRPYDETKKFLTDLGLEVTTGGTWEGTRYEFFNTHDDLKFDLEIQSWPFDEAYPPADKTYPPTAS